MKLCTYQQARRRVYDRDQGRCVVCGRWIDAGSVHHRQGRSGPDPHRLSNLILCCGTGTTGCHGRIHANPAWAYAQGLMVRRHSTDTTTDVPVHTWAGILLLTDQGDFHA